MKPCQERCSCWSSAPNAPQLGRCIQDDMLEFFQSPKEQPQQKIGFHSLGTWKKVSLTSCRWARLLLSARWSTAFHESFHCSSQAPTAIPLNRQVLSHRREERGRPAWLPNPKLRAGHSRHPFWNENSCWGDKTSWWGDNSNALRRLSNTGSAAQDPLSHL